MTHQIKHHTLTSRCIYSLVIICLEGGYRLPFGDNSQVAGRMSSKKHMVALRVDPVRRNFVNRCIDALEIMAVLLREINQGNARVFDSIKTHGLILKALAWRFHSTEPVGICWPSRPIL